MHNSSATALCQSVLYFNGVVILTPYPLFEIKEQNTFAVYLCEDEMQVHCLVSLELSANTFGRNKKTGMLDQSLKA